MERHLSHSALVGLFSGEADRPEVDAAVPHLVRCRPCLDRAAGAVAELKRAGRLASPGDARNAILALLDEEERDARNRLLARAAWEELKSLSPEEQIERIRTEPSLQTQEMFEVVVEEAASLAPHDPFLGEETALVAHALAGRLPPDRFSQALRNDRLGEAMELVANCRRLAADWHGCADALGAAQKHCDQGTGKPARKARLLSIQASLATDTGHLEQAQSQLARAADLYRKAGDPPALASTTLKIASALLAAGRYEEATSRAEEAMRLLTPREIRLEMLSRNMITECLVFLGRPASALKNYLATRPLREHHRQRRTELQSEYLEALLLDSLGHAREAEKAFRSNVAGLLDAELYKDAFLTLLTRFELPFRRGETEKAARACEEALETIRQAGAACHAQMEELWRRLLAMVHARQLTEIHLLAARQYLVRHWYAPARQAPLEQVGSGQAASVLPVQRPTVRAPMPSPADAGFEVDDYEGALERHDRAIIAVGLAQCRGNCSEAASLLGIARATLRSRIFRYGLTAAVREAASEDDDTGLDVLTKEDRKALGWLRARAWWAELRSLSTSEQLARFETVQALRTRELFEVILEEAAASAPSDPRRAEEIASVAYSLAGILPKSSCSVPVKHDLQAAARWVAANCRRLMGDWQGSAAAFTTARSHLDRGTGEPSREARLLSVEASLSTDMGQHEEALALLARASALYRSIEDPGGVAATAGKEASALLAASRHVEAISRAEVALRLLPPGEVRLELLARSLITECLVFLGRPAEALRSLQAARPLYDQLRGGQSELQLTYLEALVLDSLGLERQAEIVFRANVAGLLEAGLSKDAFLTLLTRVELRFRRGELDKAALACKEAIALMSRAGKERHAQVIGLFRDLLPLTEPRLLEARHALLRCWATPEKEAAPEPARRQGRAFVAPELPPVPVRLAPGDYDAATERYEREVILAGLSQAQGSISEACRLLGISRNTLRERMSRYGLREPAEPSTPR